jgi:glutamyl-tRNA reductase
VHTEIFIVGLNHRSAPIQVRESVALEKAQITEALGLLRGISAIRESVILTTCNRIEVVAAAPETHCAMEAVKSFIEQRRSPPNNGSLDDHLYNYRGADAVRHLFRVAASLDSMVVGEPQILGQLKDHYNVAQKAGTVGAVLHRLFHRSFFVAKRVRTETGIASRAVSVSSVAVELAERIFDRFEEKTVMLIGAGKMGDLMARHLQRCGVKSIMVTNRTFERAVELAEKIHGNPIRYDDFPRYLRLADLVIGCAGASEMLIDAGMVEKVLRERKQAAMFFIDIGDRRNFDPAINAIDNAYIYNIDDLKSVAEENLNERSSEAEKAEGIVQEEVGSFLDWVNSLEQVPTITALREKLEVIRQKEITKSLSGGLKDLSEKQKQAIEDMTAAMMKKILHAPITHLKQHTDSEDELMYIAALKRLFDLEEQ